MLMIQKNNFLVPVNTNLFNMAIPQIAVEIEF